MSIKLIQLADITTNIKIQHNIKKWAASHPACSSIKVNNFQNQIKKISDICSQEKNIKHACVYIFQPSINYLLLVLENHNKEFCILSSPVENLESENVHSIDKLNFFFMLSALFRDAEEIEKISNKATEIWSDRLNSLLGRSVAIKIIDMGEFRPRAIIDGVPVVRFEGFNLKASWHWGNYFVGTPVAISKDFDKPEILQAVKALLFCQKDFLTPIILYMFKKYSRLFETYDHIDSFMAEIAFDIKDDPISNIIRFPLL